MLHFQYYFQKLYILEGITVNNHFIPKIFRSIYHYTLFRFQTITLTLSKVKNHAEPHTKYKFTQTASCNVFVYSG